MQFEEVSPTHAAILLPFVTEVRERDPASFAAFFDGAARGGAWTEATGAEFARACARDRLDWRPKAKQISTTTYLLIEGEIVRGVARLRFPLTPAIEASGGNFTFLIAPSSRGRGLGPVLLNRLLFEGARAGLARALVTCAPANEAARRCVIHNRGSSAGVTGDRAHFWIPLR